MNESILKIAFGRFKKNALSYVAVGILCGLFMALLAMFSFLDGAISLLTIPFLALPFLFACFIACYYLEINQPITASAFFHYYFGYFRPQFRGTFKGIKYFLLSLAVYCGGLMISYLVFCYIFYRMYGNTFQSSLEALIIEYMNSSVTYETILSALEENNGMLLTFFSYVTAFPIIPSFIFFIYGISFSSISLYYRANIMAAAPSLIRLGINNAYLNSGHQMRKDWFKLNWAMLVLPLVGATVAALIYFGLVNNPSFLSPMIVLGCVTLLIFFLPFYFPNMEVIYHRYENSFKEGNKKAIEMVLMRIQNSIDLSEEEKRSLEDSFNSQNDEKE